MHDSLKISKITKSGSKGKKFIFCIYIGISDFNIPSYWTIQLTKRKDSEFYKNSNQKEKWLHYILEKSANSPKYLYTYKLWTIVNEKLQN